MIQNDKLKQMIIETHNNTLNDFAIDEVLYTNQFDFITEKDITFLKNNGINKILYNNVNFKNIEELAILINFGYKISGAGTYVISRNLDGTPYKEEHYLIIDLQN